MRFLGLDLLWAILSGWAAMMTYGEGYIWTAGFFLVLTLTFVTLSLLKTFLLWRG